MSGRPLSHGLGDRRFAAAFNVLAAQADLDDVGPEQQRKEPVDHDADPPAPTPHLEQMVRAPEYPCQGLAHPDLDELAERFAASRRVHRPQSSVDERPRRAKVERPDGVSGEHLGLAQGVLREARVRLASRRRRAIAQTLRSMRRGRSPHRAVAVHRSPRPSAFGPATRSYTRVLSNVYLAVSRAFGLARLDAGRMRCPAETLGEGEGGRTAGSGRENALVEES
jgi:hypothetical protein